MKMLFVATVPSMIGKFNMRNIDILKKMGYDVAVACNFRDRSVWSEEQIAEFRHKLEELDIAYHQVDYPRKPWRLVKVLKSYFQSVKLIKSGHFDAIHSQSCVSGVVIRLVALKKNMKVIHTEHGFYYFRGGPILNWLFYPIDKLTSRVTDALVTINRSDYAFASKHFKHPKVFYIPGIGIDTEKFEKAAVDKSAVRGELGIPEDAQVILSVGELNDNKNHAVIIRALAFRGRKNLYYVICGDGSLKIRLQKLAERLNIPDHVLLLGYRNDIHKICKIADIFAFPSRREGLGLAALEGMASGLPLIASNKNGIRDYAENGVNGFLYDPADFKGFSAGMRRLADDAVLRKEFAERNVLKAREFDQASVDQIMQSIYERMLNWQMYQKKGEDING